MHVVIVGGEFGGIKAALELSKRHTDKVTLITDQPYFLHHATLYATATGKSTEESVIPLNVIFADHPSVEIIEDTITSFDPHRKLVSSKKKDYHYDKLILALPTVTNFQGVHGETHAYGIKTLEEVRQFQDHIHDEVVKQKLDSTYFVIGGGLTGVEMASALREHLQSLKNLYRLPHAQPRVTLVEAAARIVPRLSVTASRKITHQLKKGGVRVLTRHTVTSLANNTITIGNQLYPTTTGIWTSGSALHPFFTANAGYFTFDESGLVSVNPYLEALDNVYVIGANNNTKHSGLSVASLRQGKRVAKNIALLAMKQSQKPYRAGSVPVGVAVGAHWGYAEWFGIYVAGRSGKVASRWIELYGYCQLVPFATALPIWRAHDTKDVDDLF